MTAETSIKHVKSDSLVKIRLYFYVLAFIHLALLAIHLLTKDFTQSKDPAIWKYNHVKFRLITAWFNLLTLAYMPISIYCEWRDLNGDVGLSHVKLLNKLRYLLFTSILFPVTVFVDLQFWVMWNIDTSFIVPPSIDEFIPLWAQHCLHTVSLIVSILDLLLLPRHRPGNMKFSMAVLFCFSASYLVMSGYSISQGENIYPFVKLLSYHSLLIFAVYTLFGVFICYTCQLFIMDILWGQKKNNNKKIS